MRKQKPSNFKFTRFLSATLLLLFAATGAAHAQPMPVSGFMTFTFPGYTSIHNCDDIDDGLSPAECIDFLKMIMTLANDSKDPGHQDIIDKMGRFGAHPLLLGSASVLSCRGNNCRALEPVRGGPPEGDLQPPHIRIMDGARLIYPKTGSFDGHQLIITTAKGTWKSDIIKDAWDHEYLTAQFSKNRPGQLAIKRDWKQTLTNTHNYDFITGYLYLFAWIWGVLMLATVVFTPLVSLILPGQCSWRLQAFAILTQAITLVVAVFLMLFAASLMTQTHVLAMVVVIPYLAAIFADRWILNHLTRHAYSHAWHVIAFTKITIIVLLLIGSFVLAG